MQSRTSNSCNTLCVPADNPKMYKTVCTASPNRSTGFTCELSEPDPQQEKLTSIPAGITDVAASPNNVHLLYLQGPRSQSLPPPLISLKKREGKCTPGSTDSSSSSSHLCFSFLMRVIGTLTLLRRLLRITLKKIKNCSWLFSMIWLSILSAEPAELIEHNPLLAFYRKALLLF